MLILWYQQNTARPNLQLASTCAAAAAVSHKLLAPYLQHI